MKIWTVANQKGGVGKTTTAVCLGGLLADWGFRTLLVDIDPHGSLTSYFRYDPDGLEKSVYALFQAVINKTPIDPRDLLCSTSEQGLDLLPASIALATLDRQAGKLEGMGLVLKNALRQLEPHYDYALIDCPPMLGVLMVNALAAGEKLIIPVQTEFLALKGLERMLHTLGMILKARKMPLSCLVVPTLFDKRTRASHDSLRVLRERWSVPVWEGVIPVDTRFREASRAGVPPARYDPRGRGVEAYAALLETLRREEGVPRQTGLAG